MTEVDDTTQDVLLRFIRLLCFAWGDLEFFSHLDSTQTLLEDWTQANWELLVEGSLSPGPGYERVFLSIYGSGSDSVPGSSRVFAPQAVANHAIYCTPKSGSAVTELVSGDKIPIRYPGVKLCNFVAFEDGWFFEKPPFDCILLEQEDSDSSPQVIRVEDINFVIAAYDGD